MHIYQDQQTGGRGYIGLATMIFGNWRPGGVAMGAGLFGFMDALQLRGGGPTVHALLLLVAVLLAALALWKLRKGGVIQAAISGVIAAGLLVWYLMTDTVPLEFVEMSPYITTLAGALARRAAAADPESHRQALPQRARHMTSDPVDASGVDWAALRASARDAMSRAYAPYSGFPVGAAALADDGRTVTGCNVENAAFGVALCAECGLISSLHRLGRRAAHRVHLRRPARRRAVPCGRCRQLLWEHGGPELLMETDRRRRAAAGRPASRTLSGRPTSNADAAAHGAAASAPSVLPCRPIAPATCRAAPGAYPVRVVNARPRFPALCEGDSSSMTMDVISVIRTKRDRGALTDEQIDWVIDAYTRGEVADEQMSALAMAILLNGMSRAEIARWTGAMIASGERMDFSALTRPTADKHSTGGVGDKITLPLAPLVAACGAAVPQLSGRGLGHTGGTLDKLESIPGWRASLTNDEMLAVLGDAGAVICAAGDGLAPADRKLYALRDVTGTVESIPLIASSIMSKKIAEGTGSLVLDVKVGLGRVHEVARRRPRTGRHDGRVGQRPRRADTWRCSPTWPLRWA